MTLHRSAADDRKRQRALALEREVLLVSLRTLGREGLGGKPVKRGRGSDGGMCLRRSLDFDEHFQNLGLKPVKSGWRDDRKR